MKLTEHQKSVKTRLNKTLSSTVKLLQQECALRTDNLPTVQSDSDTAQQLTAVLEASFIHGLKEAYYETKKHRRDLPIPQFWNLIRKISHKDTLTQTQELNYIKTHVGQCRAWLRLALNESSLSSYTSSLLHTPEYKPLLKKYYEAHALLRDNEQSDIFLSHLQGVENLHFELSCNSSVLNSWTRTPLELGGVIAPNTVKRKPLLNEGHLSVPTSTLRLKHSSSYNQLKSGETPSLPSSRRGSVSESLQIPFSTSPTSSVSSMRASSLPFVQVLAGLEVNDSNMVEVLPEAGQAFSPPDKKHADATNNDSSVLHRRHLMRRRGNKGKRRQLGDCASCTGSCSSSPNSVVSFESSLSSSKVEVTPGASRVSSIASSPSHLPTTVSMQAGHHVNESSTQPNSEVPASKKTDVEIDSKSFPSEDSSFNPVHQSESQVSNDINSSESYSANSQTSILVQPDHTTHTLIPGEDRTSGNGTHNQQTVYDDFILRSSTPSKEFIEKKSFPSLHGLNLDAADPPTSSHHQFDDEKDVDPTDASHSSSDMNPTVLEEAPQLSCAHVSIGQGNSLLCGVGWSSDHVTTTVDGKETDSSSPVVKPPVSANGHLRSSRPTETTAIRREGYLQKKGETLLFWRTRWFVLSDGILSYYKDRKCKEKLGFIHLRDVDRVEEEDISKSRTICLKMLNGTEHQLAAESKTLIAEWSKDVIKMTEAYKASMPLPSSLDSIENSYEVLEEYRIDKDGPLRPSETNTSYLATMKNHMIKIANEKGLDVQNYQCADCASPIGMIYGSPRLCSFTGQYYCTQCHLNEEHMVPSRMIHNWDFRKHKVSKRSKRFLEDMWKEPCIEMDRVNPAAYRHLAELRKLLPLRQQLAALHPYISTCRIIPLGQFNSKLLGHHYMLEHPHRYSPHDINKLHAGGLIDLVSKAVSFGIDHVRSCDLCSVKGFVCEVCHKNEIIFAFEADKTYQCDECKGVYHKDCLKDVSKCPKCERRNRRLKREEQFFYEQSEEN